METFLIGDPHFCHKNIIKYCNRPFETVNEMNEALISNWNKTVGKQDIVYCLGDFALCGKDKIVEIGQRLNGRKRLILGNHDGASLNTYRDAGFEYVYNHPILVDDFYILSHMPQHVQPDGLYANIYAHVHDDPSYKDVSPRSFCASAERIEYTPIPISKVKEEMIKCEEIPSLEDIVFTNLIGVDFKCQTNYDKVMTLRIGDIVSSCNELINFRYDDSKEHRNVSVQFDCLGYSMSIVDDGTVKWISKSLKK